jgi:glutamate-ammonia-ligase adenylyltransferase
MPMARARFLQRLEPLPSSPRGEEALQRLRDAAARQDRLERLENYLADADVSAFLASAFADCPYLLDLAGKDIGRLADILDASPNRVAATAIAMLESDNWTSRPEAMTGLRQAKQYLALGLGLADLAGAIDLAGVTAGLTGFADAAMQAALGFALAEERQKGKWLGKGPESCGLALLAMGKQGAHELNYSSDIDIIAIYEPQPDEFAEGVEPAVFWVKIVRLLVTLLQERTADGYVFRTDLRLRPDPGATPVAISILAALQYYESMGQNWERAALIKARAAAGDLALGEQFLTEIAPFIWRRYLDFAAIADIHSIKRQLHAHRGHGAVKVAGHDIKSGRGGIREIELFVQTQQLIAGGRDAGLRGRETRAMLVALCERSWIDDEVRAQFDEAYVFFRKLEHRLQMVRDEQTHLIPESREDFSAIARLMGFSVVARFEDEVHRRLSLVADRYSQLFEDAPALSSDAGNLVFTGGDDDPETLETLTRMGFADPPHVTRTVRAWHFGRYAATRSTKARERLTEMTPALLQALAGSGNADAAFRAFDGLLKGLPAGVQLFSMLAANRQLLDLITRLLSVAPAVAETLVRRPGIVDALIDPASFAEGAGDGNVYERLAESLDQALDFEDILNRVRLFVAENRFLISVRLLTLSIDAAQAGRLFSVLAEAAVDALFRAVEADFAQSHGRLPGGRAALLAFGRLGSCEMTAASDLDLIVVYDHDADATTSDGPRPLAPSQYYARLTQRLVGALSAPTGEGVAYEVDMRLRPSGRAGPLATHIDAFTHYQTHDAWTWEHMALVRARPVCGDAELCRQIEAVIAKVLSRQRDKDTLKREIWEMREKVDAARGSADPWSLKMVRGGLVDLEFTAQYAVLAGLERISGEPTRQTLLRAAKAGILQPADAEQLDEAVILQNALFQGLRVAAPGRFDPDSAPAGLKDFLVGIAALPPPADHDRSVPPEPVETVIFKPPPGKPPAVKIFDELSISLRDIQDAVFEITGRILDLGSGERPLSEGNGGDVATMETER